MGQEEKYMDEYIKEISEKIEDKKEYYAEISNKIWEYAEPRFQESWLSGSASRVSRSVAERIKRRGMCQSSVRRYW